MPWPEIDLKRGVRLDDLSTQMVVALFVLCGVYSKYSIPKLTITSAWRKARNKLDHPAADRKPASFHFSGRAMDFRTNNIDDTTLGLVVRDYRAALGDQFDVVLEDQGGPNEHLHVEFDPDNDAFQGRVR